jgi:hypothetical protein
MKAGTESSLRNVVLELKTGMVMVAYTTPLFFSVFLYAARKY